MEQDSKTLVLLPSSVLFENVPVPAYSFRAEGEDFILERINAAGNKRNPAFAALRGMSMVSLYRDQPQVIEDARRCACEEVSVERELPVRRYDRTEATQFLRLTFVPAPPEHILLFLQDVANPDVAEIAMRESEARYQSLIASLPDAVVVRGADGRVLFCNELAAQLCGARKPADLLGSIEILDPDLRFESDLGEAVPPSEFPGLEALATGKGERGRTCALVGQGQLRWVRVAAQPIKNPCGQVTGSVATLTEITEQIEAQGALSESAARLDLALAAARMGVWEFDPAADLGWWSPNLDAMFHVRGRVRGLSGFLAHVHSDDHALVLRELSQLTREGDARELEFRVAGEDQVTRWVRIRGQLLRRGARKCIGGAVMDITEQRHLEEELHRASRLESIGRLAGGVAHDFNNLLAAMLGSIELVEARCPPDAQEDLATIRHSALRARDLTRQLLAFARKQPVAWKTVELASLVKQVELMLRRLVGPKIEILVSTSEPVYVRADPSLLEQVLVNLVVNGRDAMSSGGRLTIKVERQHPARSTVGGAKGCALLTVSDSGAGMDEGTCEKIFDPFFSTKAHGTGLGLASSYGIVKQHQGEIRVESKSGQGSSFIITLPCVSEDKLEESASAAGTVPRSTKGVVLVIDDEATVRDTAVRLVRSLGYEALGAENGVEAIQHFSRQGAAIDTLLCDVIMPGQDGPSLASELLRLRPELRVVFMSGYPFDVRDERLRYATHLQKPFSRAELAKKLAEG